MQGVQKTVDVYLGDTYLTTIPKANEANLREVYAGTEDERRLRIIDPEKKAQIEQERQAALKKIEEMNKQKQEFEASKKELEELRKFKAEQEAKAKSSKTTADKKAR